MVAVRAAAARRPAPRRPSRPGLPARIRSRYAELYAKRTSTEAKLTALQQATPHDNDPELLDQLPAAAGLMASAPDRIKAALMAAFDIQALYNKDTDQVTIWATLTQDTPAPSPPCSPTPAPTTTPATPPPPPPTSPPFHIQDPALFNAFFSVEHGSSAETDALLVRTCD